jgi:hypothetical protein
MGVVQVLAQQLLLFLDLLPHTGDVVLHIASFSGQFLQRSLIVAAEILAGTVGGGCGAHPGTSGHMLRLRLRT